MDSFYLIELNDFFTMKRIFAIFISTVCLSIFHDVNAQNKIYPHDEVYLVSNPQTARWSYVETDSNGKRIATIYNSVESLVGNAVNGKLKLRVEEVPVATPKDTIKSFSFYRFKDGEFIADIFTGLEDNLFEGKLDNQINNTIQEKYPDLSEEEKMDLVEKVKSNFYNISGEMRGMPRYPKTGKLPDYEFNCKVSIVSMKVIGEDRKIVGRESIRTDAGLFDCFILEETITTRSMMMKDVEKIKSWYAYGIGLVKEITCDKNGKLVSTMILNEINW